MKRRDVLGMTAALAASQMLPIVVRAQESSTDNSKNNTKGQSQFLFHQ